MSRFYESHNAYGQLSGVSKSLSGSKYELSMSVFRKKTYVHISDIRNCFEDGQFVYKNRKSISMPYDCAMELKQSMERLPMYKEQMENKKKDGLSGKRKATMEDGGIPVKFARLSLPNYRTKLIHKDGVWKRIVEKMEVDNITPPPASTVTSPQQQQQQQQHQEQQQQQQEECSGINRKNLISLPLREIQQQPAALEFQTACTSLAPIQQQPQNFQTACASVSAIQQQQQPQQQPQNFNTEQWQDSDLQSIDFTQLLCDYETDGNLN